jgi:hypothetical protein
LNGWKEGLNGLVRDERKIEKPKAPPSKTVTRRGIIRLSLSEVNMGATDRHRRISELEEQVNNLLRDKHDLEEKVIRLTPRKVYVATLNSNRPLFWVEA